MRVRSALEARDEAAPPDVERVAGGLRLRGHSLFLEPHGRPQLGFLAHARGARPVLPERTITTAGTLALLQAALPRALRRAAALPIAWRSPFTLGSLRLTLSPAGHVLGSAQLRCEADDLDLVYTGDLGGAGKRASRTAEPREQLACQTLVVRAIYGHPRYVFPPRDELLERAAEFVERALGRGKLPVLVAAALGSTQDLVRHLGARGRTPRLHPTALRACEVYAAQGIALPGFAKQQDEGDVLIVPPTARLDAFDRERHSLCILSGHALDGAHGGDEALPLSDHAGFDELVAYAQRSGARRVLCLHGHAEELAAALREKKIAAVALPEHHQLRLPGF